MKFPIDSVLSFVGKTQCPFKDFDRKTPVILFGAGRGLSTIISMFREHGIEPIAATDSDPRKWGTQVDDLTIMPPTEVEKHFPHCIYFVSAPAHAQYIIPQLEKQFTRGRVLSFDNPQRVQTTEFSSYLTQNVSALNQLYSSLSDETSRRTMVAVLQGWVSGDFHFFESVFSPHQYFPPDVMQLTDEEIFVDGGAYIGDTVLQFLEACDRRYHAIFALEPNPACRVKLLQLQCQVSNLRIISKGLYDSHCWLPFTLGNSLPESHFTPEDSESPLLEVDCLDNLLPGPLTLLKMDIEGFERYGLRGASSLIKAHKPKLAICVYHRADDLLTIANFIQTLNPNYSLYLRHHSYYWAETVLYAL